MVQVVGEFKYFPMKLIDPEFGDPLTDLIIELDHQRQFRLEGTTPIELFIQFKQVFHLLESLASARIENNRTTVAELIDNELEQPKHRDSQYLEIINIEKTMEFIESLMSDEGFNAAIGHNLMREIHKRVTAGLPVSKEGDTTPGEYRKGYVSITNAEHSPPPPGDVFSYMDELIQFYNQQDQPKYDLLKIALAHHRFAWIHPFSNGNGRTVRLMTYAMLLNAGFRVGGKTPVTRMLNPAAVFCSDRDVYYRKLSEADTGTKEGLLQWCRYVLEGLKTELKKIDRLLDYEYVKTEILKPAVTELHRKNGISDQEGKILMFVIDRTEPVQNKDIRGLLEPVSQVHVSRIISDLKERKLLVPTVESERKYFINLNRSPLMRDIIRQLDKNDFLPMRGEI